MTGWTPTDKESRPMSKITELATGQLTATETITVELEQRRTPPGGGGPAHFA
jgi:hypothetical protein